jgi:deazaflavin-dependent oxidoreductase (nitroreductase family)
MTPARRSWKRALFRVAEKYLANPPTRVLLRLGIPTPLVLVETVGRRTGKRRQTPVMKAIIDGAQWIVAEHGSRADYVRNIRANPAVRVRCRRRWHDGVAEVLDGDDPMARTEWIAERLGRSKRAALLVTRLLAVDPVTVRITLAPADDVR